MAVNHVKCPERLQHKLDPLPQTESQQDDKPVDACLSYRVAETPPGKRTIC